MYSGPQGHLFKTETSRKKSPSITLPSEQTSLGISPYRLRRPQGRKGTFANSLLANIPQHISPGLQNLRQETDPLDDPRPLQSSDANNILFGEGSIYDNDSKAATGVCFGFTKQPSRDSMAPPGGDPSSILGPLAIASWVVPRPISQNTNLLCFKSVSPMKDPRSRL